MIVRDCLPVVISPFEIEVLDGGFLFHLPFGSIYGIFQTLNDTLGKIPVTISPEK